MSSIPYSIEKRNALYGAKKMTTENIQKLISDFVSEDWKSDAIDFLVLVQKENSFADQVKKMADAAISEGNFFLLQKLLKLSDSLITQQMIQSCAETAEKLGKTRYAISAWEHLGNSENVARLKATIAEDGDQQSLESHVFIPATIAEFGN